MLEPLFITVSSTHCCDGMRPKKEMFDVTSETERETAGGLDPADWTAFETAAETLLRTAFDRFRNAADGPVWQPTPDALKTDLQQYLPKKGVEYQQLVSRLQALMPYGVGNTHPRFFGWVHGSGSPGNLLAEIAASAMNANCGGRDHVGIYVERQVIDWCRHLFGFPNDSSGLIVSGTSMATIIAVKVARDRALEFSNRVNGLSGAPLVGYVSEQAHACLDRAFDMTGLGTAALRKIKVDAEFRIDLEDLTQQIARDREEGRIPFFLAATAGTVNTGAIDDLQSLADLAANERLWYHIDGAFGACAKTSPAIAQRLAGIERADSLAFDFHKWMHVNYDAGCVLIRDSAAHRRAFANRPDYLAASGEALAGGDPWPVDFGPELSRGFRALKVWSHLLEHGMDKIGDCIARNCEQAAYLADRVAAHPALELAAPASLSICCLRYRAPDLAPEARDRLNARIVSRLQCEGTAAPSTTRLNERLAIRVNITNHRTRRRDLNVLIDAVAATGAEILNQSDKA